MFSQNLKNRTPQGQFLTEKFPVLTYGPTPIPDKKTWKFKVFGLVEEAKEFTYQQFLEMPQVKIRSDFHCVTRWSRLDNDWEGISVLDFMKNIKLKENTKFVLVHGYGNYTTNLPVKVFLDDDTIFAHTHNGKPLTTEHGGPLRLVVPKRYAWKSAKWVNGLEFLEKDVLGFWEKNGYNNNADPWKEERYW